MKVLLILGSVLLLQDAPPPAGGLAAVERDIAAAVEKARKWVAIVKATYSIDLKGAAPIAESIKLSGIVYGEDGVILTDANAIESATSITVQLPDGREVPARVVATDRLTSIAVLRVDAGKLVPAEFAPVAEIKQGIYAIALGNSQGLKASSSVGFVSGMGRSIQVAGRRFDDLIQMTTPVQPGDCGGIVANSRGQVIGMIHSSHAGEAVDPDSLGILRLFGKDPGDLAAASATTFATPAGTLKFVAARIAKHGRMMRGVAGLTIRPLDEDTRLKHRIPPGQGAEIFGIDRNGPAKRAGLQRHDILLNFDGKAVADLPSLRREVAAFEESRTVKTLVIRDGERKEVEIAIEVEPQP